jgi:DNA repair protein RecN (Recombination protein N)
MLRLLRIRNLAVIERLEIEFRGGFTVLTGETGAGKSIGAGLNRAGKNGFVKASRRSLAKCPFFSLLFLRVSRR